MICWPLINLWQLWERYERRIRAWCSLKAFVMIDNSAVFLSVRLEASYMLLLIKMDSSEWKRPATVRQPRCNGSACFCAYWPTARKRRLERCVPLQYCACSPDVFSVLFILHWPPRWLWIKPHFFCKAHHTRDTKLQRIMKRDFLEFNWKIFRKKLQLTEEEAWFILLLFALFWSIYFLLC